MDISGFGIASVAVITVICYLIGMAVKATAIENKWIPIIVGVSGGVLGLVGMLIMADFPATDYLTAVAVGIVSGLASTGVNQIAKQMSNSNCAPRRGTFPCQGKGKESLTQRSLPHTPSGTKGRNCDSSPLETPP